MKDSQRKKITRRTVIASATLIPIAAIKGAPQTAASAAPAAVFSPEQRRILDAIVNRLVPKDENGPSAAECGVPEYIDRCLADYLSAEKTAFLEGLAGLDSFARSSQGRAFDELTAEKQDAVLAAIDSGPSPNGAPSIPPNLRGFFNRTRRLTLEAMFSDPVYGGNRNFAGWDLIRYPGAKLAAAPEDQSMKAPPQPYRKPIYGGNDHGH